MHIKKGEASAHLLFPHSKEWRDTAVVGPGGDTDFLSTEGEGSDRVIEQPPGGEGSAAPCSSGLRICRERFYRPRSTSREPHRPARAARDAGSWRLLQLEPSSLRKPDAFTAPQHLGPDGSHLPATLYRLARSNGGANGRGTTADGAAVYARVANRLSGLIGDVWTVAVDRDERPGVAALTVTTRDGTAHPARALSDGTLRFLALSVIELDPSADRLLCLEGPRTACIRSGSRPSSICFERVGTDPMSRWGSTIPSVGDRRHASPPRGRPGSRRRTARRRAQ